MSYEEKKTGGWKCLNDISGVSKFVLQKDEDQTILFLKSEPYDNFGVGISNSHLLRKHSSWKDDARFEIRS